MRLTILLCLLTYTGFCQETFIKIYELDSPSAGFSHSIITNDTIVLYGELFNDSITQRGILFAKVDTFGIYAQQKNYFSDSVGLNITGNQGYQIIETTNGGFLMTGNVPGLRKSFLLSTDSDGNVLFNQDYPNNSNILTSHQKYVEELADGYLLFGRKQKTSDDYNLDAFVMKTDFAGNKVWEKYYNGGTPGRYDRFIGTHQNGDGNIVMTGYSVADVTLTGPNPTPLNQWTYKYASVTLDADSGEIIDVWETDEKLMPDTEDGNAITRPLRDIDNNYILAEHTIVVSYFPPDPQPYISWMPRITKRNAEFERIWSTPLSDAATSNLIYDLIATPEGGYLAAGTYFTPATDSTSAGYKGLLGKVDATGNLQWVRSDTITADSSIGEGAGIDYNAVHVLPSGSIMVTGRFGFGGRTYGCITKLDADGCLEPGCHPNLTSVNVAEIMQGIEVFPNPTTGYITVRAKGDFTTEIYNINGKRVRAAQDFQGEGQLDISDLPNGMYFVNVRKGAYFIYSKRVVKK